MSVYTDELQETYVRSTPETWLGTEENIEIIYILHAKISSAKMSKYEPCADWSKYKVQRKYGSYGNFKK